MPYFPQITETKQNEVITRNFLGYNHQLKIGEGSDNVKPVSGLEFYDMSNLTSDYYPLLGNRRRRGIAGTSGISPTPGTVSLLSFEAVFGMAVDGEGNIYLAAELYGDTSPKIYKIYKTKTVTVGGVSTVYKYSAPCVDWSARLVEKTWYTGGVFTLSETPKTMFIVSNKLIIFPDKVSVNIEDAQNVQWEPLGAEKTISPTASKKLIYSRCDSDGTASATGTCTKIALNNSGWLPADLLSFMAFKEGDCISVNAAMTPSGEQSERTVLSGYYTVTKRVSSYIVIDAVIEAGFEQSDGELTLLRYVPDMDYVVQCKNRLWGCRYGVNAGDSRVVNEIYASKLGDFTNWRVNAGISTDSYTASIGTPGEWTGAIVVGDNPCFFKEDRLHKVYISSTGAHQIVDKACFGVQKGCSGSLAMVGDVCLYKSRRGVIAYDGSSMNLVSEDLGEVRYLASNGGAVGLKYYCSMKDEAGEWSMFAYGLKTGLWHKEDSTEALCFCSSGSDSFFAAGSDEDYKIYVMSEFEVCDNYEEYGSWMAETGLIGYNYSGEQYITRINLRMVLPEGSKLDIALDYDSLGTWEQTCSVCGHGTRSFVLPILPRRCDHFRIRLMGEGDCRIYGMSRIFEGGSDIR